MIVHRLLPSLLALLAGSCATTTPIVAPAASPTPRVTTPAPARPTARPGDAPFVPRKLLAIDWDHVAASNEAEALALWRVIAPTGADWEAKVDEIPSDKPVARALAIALLHEGNFACGAVPRACQVAIDVEAPRADATLAEPCLRRMLALWAIDQLEDDDLPVVRDALRAIVATPGPDTQLVAAALHVFEPADQDERLRLLVSAWTAGHRDLVATLIGWLDEAHQITAARQHHLDPAVDVLSPQAHRQVFLAAVTDEQLTTKQRAQALVELATVDLADALPADVRQVALAAAASRDCTLAATAARILDGRGDHRFVPRRTAALRTEAQLMRAMCVLASFEAQQGNDEASLLPTFLAKDGLERVDIAYDASSDTDDDGDGDPHTSRTANRVERDAATLPELEDLIRAMRSCTGATCVSDDHEFRFVWTPTKGTLVLAKLEVWERPACVLPAPPKP